MEEKKQTDVLGIISVVMGVIGFFAFGLIFGTAALVMGAIGWKDGDLSKLGAILGGIDVLAILLLLLMV